MSSSLHTTDNLKWMVSKPQRLNYNRERNTLRRKNKEFSNCFMVVELAIRFDAEFRKPPHNYSKLAIYTIDHTLMCTCYQYFYNNI